METVVPETPGVVRSVAVQLDFQYTHVGWQFRTALSVQIHIYCGYMIKWFCIKGLRADMIFLKHLFRSVELSFRGERNRGIEPILDDKPSH